jgi:hypothetical protein
MKRFVIKIICIGLLYPHGLSAQNTLTADNNPGAVAMFDNFADAYDAAEAGDTILVAGSPIPYGVHQIRKKLNILGPGYFLEESDGVNKQPATFGNVRFMNGGPDDNSSGSTVKGLSFNNQLHVDENVANVVIDKCRISWAEFYSSVVLRRCYVTGTLNFRDGSSGSVIVNSIINSIFSTGGRNSSISMNISNCVIRGTISVGHSVSFVNTIFANIYSFSPFSNSSASYSHCMVFGGNWLPVGDGNINNRQILTGPGGVFASTTDDHWTLRHDSPAKGAGTNGSDMGAFGGPMPYVLSGISSRPRITRLVVPPTATNSSGLRVEVDAEALGN